MTKYIISAILILFTGLCVWSVTIEQQLGPVPTGKVYNNISLKNDVFLVGNSGTPSPYMTESAAICSKYCDNLVWNFYAENFTDISVMKDMLDKRIPFAVQGWGKSFVPYLKEKDALDYTWGDLNSNRKLPNATARELAVASVGVSEIWSAYIKTVINYGSSAYIFPQFATPYDFGWGSGGFSPEMIAAFKQDLSGRDKGIEVFADGKETVFKFKNYAEYYLGFMPESKIFGINSWDDYYPVRKAIYDPEGYKLYAEGSDKAEFFADIDSKTKKDYIPDFLLRDMLIHYEALKFADSLGKTASENGGTYIINSENENMANGNDVLFLACLKNLGGLALSYNSEKDFSKMAYSRTFAPSFAINNIKGKRSGYVLNFDEKDNPYISFIQTYEGKAATNSQMCITDSWPVFAEADMSFAKFSQSNPTEKVKATNIIAASNGFSYAAKDGVKKLNPDFTTVISRNIFRPWDSQGENVIEKNLADSGYIFDTVGFESVQNLKGEIVFWSCVTPPAKKFEAFLEKLKSGDVKTGVIFAENLDTVLDETCKIADFGLFFPDLAKELIMDKSAGTLPVKCRGVDYEISGNIYSIPKAVPALMSDDGVILVYKQKIGKSDLYILPFDPALSENASIAKFVLDVILNRSSVFPHWESVNGSCANVYSAGKDLIACVKGRLFDKEIYVSEEPAEAKIKCEKPKSLYYIYNYFDGDEESVMSDEFGYVSLKSQDKTISLFCIKDKPDTAFSDLIKVRRSQFESVLNE